MINYIEYCKYVESILNRRLCCLSEDRRSRKKERKILLKILEPKIDEHDNYLLKSDKEL